MEGRKMKEGDLVKIKNGNGAVRLDSYEVVTLIGFCTAIFKVISVDRMCYYQTDFPPHHLVHDVVIKNTQNGRIYLHSIEYLQDAVAVKKVTVADVSRKYGCEIEIIEG
jgi:hypothetical protein